MNLTLQNIVEFFLLILFATVHGYLGAWLAVRMLFRPRRPIKLFNVTVFPQGMIPRHRDRLAQAIGKAVGEELVSEETILKELFEKDFLRNRIQKGINQYIHELLLTELPSVIDSVPSKLRDPLLEAFASLQTQIGIYISNSLKSPEIACSVNEFVSRKVDQMLSKRLSEMLQQEQFDIILEFLESRIHTSFKSPYFEKKVEEFVNKQIDEIFSKEVKLEEFLTPDSIELLKEKASEQVNPVIHQLAEIATSERTRNQISSIVKREVHNYYENLPFFKKIFVSRENLLKEVDSIVNESLPKKIEETLSDNSFANEARTFLVSTIDEALKKPLSEVAGNLSPENLTKLKKQVVVSILKLLQSEEMKISISNYLKDFLLRIKPHSLDAILKVVHPESIEILKKRLSTIILSTLNSEETARVTNRIISEQIEQLLSAPIGKISNHIPKEKIELLGHGITELVLDAAKQKLPNTIREFNLGEIVRQKISDYPAEKLEALVLSVAKEHLRKIELFGAFFGLIIGIVQSILSYFFFAKK